LSSRKRREIKANEEAVIKKIIERGAVISYIISVSAVHPRFIDTKFFKPSFGISYLLDKFKHSKKGLSLIIKSGLTMIKLSKTLPKNCQVSLKIPLKKGPKTIRKQIVLKYD